MLTSDQSLLCSMGSLHNMLNHSSNSVSKQQILVTFFLRNRLIINKIQHIYQIEISVVFS